tara:strand:+ start:644 stop:1144 length:501 start_codon:yes stop_codon:yes gene_type:complete
MPEPLIGIYPGTFDPITNGHADVIQRAARMLDKLVVGVAINAGKGPLFSLEERLEMVRVETAEMKDVADRIVVQGFDNLLVDFAKNNNAKVIIRGLRAVSDFDYEFQMSSMNAKLAPEVETVCLMASDRHQFIASRLVKEIAKLNGDVKQFVSPRVNGLLEKKFAK